VTIIQHEGDGLLITNSKCWCKSRSFHFRVASMIAVASFSTAAHNSFPLCSIQDMNVTWSPALVQCSWDDLIWHVAFNHERKGFINRM